MVRYHGEVLMGQSQQHRLWPCPAPGRLFPLGLQQHQFKGILARSVDVFTEGDHLEAKLIFRAATWLLSVAFVSGLAMALIRFASDRQSPPWIAKLHGFAAAGALSLLIFGWVNVSLPRAGLYGTLTLLVAVVGGLFLNLGITGSRSRCRSGSCLPTCPSPSSGFSSLAW